MRYKNHFCEFVSYYRGYPQFSEIRDTSCESERIIDKNHEITKIICALVSTRCRSYTYFYTSIANTVTGAFSIYRKFSSWKSVNRIALTFAYARQRASGNDTNLGFNARGTLARYDRGQPN